MIFEDAGIVFHVNWIFSIAKTPSKKIWFALGSFGHSRLPFISINLSHSLPWNTCHVSAGASGCFLDILDEREKQIWGTVDPTFPVSCESMVHYQSGAQVFSTGITLVDLHWTGWSGFCSYGKVSLYTNTLHNACNTIARCSKDG